MKVLSQTISWLFLPLLMPVYAMVVVMYIPSMENNFFQENTLYWLTPNFKLVILTWFFIFSFFAPGMSLLVLKYSKRISNIEVDNKEERAIPVTVCALFCLLLALLFIFKAPNGILPSAIYAMPWGGFLAIVIAGLINRKTKISLHGLGAGMLVGFFMSYYSSQAEFYFEIIVLSVIISGLVLSARVYLGKHTLTQVFMGFGLGFTVMFLIILLFAKFL